LLGDAGAAGSEQGDECRTIEEVFISCNEGFGGAIERYGCNDDCTRCLVGGRRWNGNCEFWHCDDGTVVPGPP
jgi:hypothetical protein